MPAIIYPTATINGQEFIDATGIVWKWKAAGSSGKWGHKAQVENVTLSGVQTITGRKNFTPPTGIAATFRSTNDYGADIQSVNGTALNVYSANNIGAVITGGVVGAVVTGVNAGAILVTNIGLNHAEFGYSGSSDHAFVARAKGAFGWVRGAFKGRIVAPDTLGANAVWTLPGSTGTLALLSDISNTVATNDARYVTLSGGQIISNVGAANVGFTVKGAVSQTAALQKWQDSGGVDLAHLGINGRLGLGTSSPSYPIHVEKNANDTTSAVIAVKNLSAGNNATAEIRAENNLGHSGTLFKPGSGYAGYKTIGPSALGLYNNQAAGNISILNDFGSGNITLTAGGSSTAHVTIASNGDTTFSNKIIASSVLRLKGYTVATLPAGPTQGDTAFVTDALTPAYLAPAMGGGSIVAPVIYNGTGWVTH